LLVVSGGVVPIYIERFPYYEPLNPVAVVEDALIPEIDYLFSPFD